EKQTTALRPAKSLTSGETVHVNSHLGVEFCVAHRRNAGGVIEQQGHFVIFGDLNLLVQLFTQIVGVDHCRIFGDGGGDFFRRICKNKFGAGKSNGAVESAAASCHYNLILHSGRVGKLPDQFVV